jgi:glycosyltransferase involved in cell wall biosynthesis
MVSRLGVLSPDDPRDRAAQSGSLYYMVKALERHFDEIHLCPPIVSLAKQAGRLADAASRRLLSRPIAYDYLAFVARRHGRIAAEVLRGQRLDAILAVMNPVDIAYLETDVPVVLTLDATFGLQHDYYPKFTHLWGFSVRQAESVERAAYRNARSVVYSSSWAAQSAIHDYGVDPHRVHVIPYGANLDCVPPRERVLRKVPSAQCRLLLVGVGWEEKGGAIALDTLKCLEAKGIEARLVICGSTPPRRLSHARMLVIPFLDKSDARQRDHLEQLYATSDFLILPTRREAFGHVFCEASAFGVPSITTNTGAVAEVVRDGENGYVLPVDAAGCDYANLIADLYRDTERYKGLVASSRAAYESRMNWDVWARAIKIVLDDCVHRPASRTKLTNENRHHPRSAAEGAVG